jgi:hypothetical protein
MSKFYRGPSIDASYQVSYHLAKRFSEEKLSSIDMKFYMTGHEKGDLLIQVIA